MINLLKDVQNGEFEEVGLKILDLKGETHKYKTYKIPLNKLKYNRKNDRIASFISEYEENRSIDDIDEDTLEEFVYESAPRDNEKTIKNIKATRQRESAVVMSDGTVIDGNRRFTCLRKLHKDDEDNEKFKYLIASVLDREKYVDKDIKKLELQIQNLEEKVSYNPIDRYVGVYRNLLADDSEFTVTEYAQDINETDKKVYEYMNNTRIMLDYLEFIGKPLQFHYARENKLDGTLNEIKKILKANGMDEQEKQLIKETAFSEFSTSVDSKKIRKLIDACRNEDVFDQERIDKAKELNNDVYNSFHENGFLDPEVKQKVSDFSDDLIEDASISKEQNKEEKLLIHAIKDVTKVDKDKIQHMNDELKNSFDERLIELKEELDELVRFANVEG
ncbi:hypothetical protein RZ77_05700 [Apilactobacillus kunkeei]|uniref:hypothetical protein n=1 Tax=Apilactobacillus kunkeei TaxID=148814 RepID=UPI0006CEA28E|nr:hypothetical protein [Apilactobacillus kunkeei]KPN83950.1 hypothetical protein RZ77_05700 [Apilactobacillus kunkeei]MCK8636076.1 hypothetical protein [Apilactobacillus kunkeei]